MTKIDVYSGFLGAGKTTLIRKMIQEAYAGQKLVLIENEFGEIGIDGGFLQDAGVQITEMNSGCICCSLVGDYGRALTQVINDYHPDRILIEPSGVGKLSDVRKAVEKVCGGDVQLGNLVTVADANKCKMYMKNFGEFYNNQVEAAGTIILSRTGDIKQEKLDTCLHMLQEKNPQAVIVTTPWEQLTGEQILSAMEKGNTLLQELEHEEHEHHHHHHDDDEECCCGHDHEHHHHHDDEECCHDHEHHHHDDEYGCGHDHDHEHEHHHDHDDHCCCGHDHDHHHHHHADEVFTSWGVETAKKFTEKEIEDILEALDEGTYGIVIRAKGIVPSQDGKWIHFDYVPEEHNIRNGGADVTGKLCVIGSKISEDRLAQLFGL